jgi:hypothetical protein
MPAKKIKKTLNPRIPAERKKLIEYAVKRTFKEYGKALQKLSRE